MQNVHAETPSSPTVGPQADTFLTLFEDAVRSGGFLRAVLSKPRRKQAAQADKVTIRPVEVRREPRFQFTARIENREHHENLDATAAIERVRQLFGSSFAHAHLFTQEADYAARFQKDGRPVITRSPPTKADATARHNRLKRYLIPEETPCPFLEEIGVMTKTGKVRASKYHKFRQINRYLEIVNDIYPALPPDGTLNVVDFGCGKSYLTFALHHLLTTIHRRTVRIVGLDRNEEVIRDCFQIAEKLNATGLSFYVSDLSTYETDDAVHLAVSLHACDTATDDALVKAIGWRANVILVVPCCRHELARTIHQSALAPIGQHGILTERFAAIATDALRAKALESLGYRTQVIEFIDMEHTTKNVLIRGIREENANQTRPDRLREFQEFRRFLGLGTTYLEHALNGVQAAHPRGD